MKSFVIVACFRQAMDFLHKGALQIINYQKCQHLYGGKPHIFKHLEYTYHYS